MADESPASRREFEELSKRVDGLAVRVDGGFERLDTRLASLAVLTQIERRLDGRIDNVEAGLGLAATKAEFATVKAEFAAVKTEVKTEVGAAKASAISAGRLAWAVLTLFVVSFVGLAVLLVKAFGG